jgi:ribosomal protein L23
MSRCKKGTRRNKTTGNCTKEGSTQKRCPNGTRKSGLLGQPCVKSENILIEKFNKMHQDMKQIAYAVEEIFYNLHEGMQPRTLKSTKTKIKSALQRISNINLKYTRMMRVSSQVKYNVHDEIHATQTHKKFIDALHKGDVTDALKLKSEYTSDIFAYIKHNEHVLANFHLEEYPDWVSFK